MATQATEVTNVTQDTTETKRKAISVSADVWARLKANAAIRRISMAQALEEAILLYVATNAEPPKISVA